MAQHVPGQLVLSEERLAAELALVRLEPSVSSHVRRQRPFLVERRRTRGTLEGFLARVRVHVLLEHKLAREALGAHVAPEWPLPSVCAHVHDHVPLVFRRVVAEDTLELLVLVRKLDEGRLAALWNTPRRANVRSCPTSRTRPLRWIFYVIYKRPACERWDKSAA